MDAGPFTALKIFRDRNGNCIGFEPLGSLLRYMNPEGREQEPRHHDDWYLPIEDALVANIFGEEAEEGYFKNISGEDQLIDLIDQGIPASSLFDFPPPFALDDSKWLCNCSICNPRPAAESKTLTKSKKRGSNRTPKKHKLPKGRLNWRNGTIGY